MRTRPRPRYTSPFVAKAQEALRQLGSEFRQRRLAAGLTEAQLALSLGITPQHLREIEVGKGDPTLKTMFILAASVGIELLDTSLIST